MKKNLLAFLPLLTLAACCKEEAGNDDICTQELRMITLHITSATKAPILLDSSYTVRLSTNERIYPQQQMTPGRYVVLDDSYHPKLRKAEDDFRFVGWRNNQVVVSETYRIAGDNCHIDRRSGADSVVVQ